MRRFIIPGLVAVASLTFVGSAQAGTCYSTGKGNIITRGVSCSTASSVLVKASDRMLVDETLNPSVRHGGHYWVCRAKFRGEHQVTIACAYDGRHALAATARF